MPAHRLTPLSIAFAGLSVACLVVAALTTLSACDRHADQASRTPEGPDSADTAPAPEVQLVAIVNTYCVVSPQDMVSPNRLTIPDLTRQFEGQTYGLCCDGCLTVWDEFTDDERRTAVQRAMAREPQP